MGRKILGILNIVAGTGILVLFGWLWSNGNLHVQLQSFGSWNFVTFLVLAVITSLAGGILVFTRRTKILVVLAAVNLVFAGFALTLAALAVSFALFD